MFKEVVDLKKPYPQKETYKVATQMLCVRLKGNRKDATGFWGGLPFDTHPAFPTLW